LFQRPDHKVVDYLVVVGRHMGRYDRNALLAVAEDRASSDSQELVYARESKCLSTPPPLPVKSTIALRRRLAFEQKWTIRIGNPEHISDPKDVREIGN
jgi:hypothetical protein